MSAPMSALLSSPSLDWTDLRVFLAVVEQGSTKRAATALRIDQTTASRRIAALEAAVGVALFERTPTGFAPTEAARQLVPAVRDMGEAAGRAATLAGQLRRDRQRVLRISVADLLVDPVVQPALIDFHRRWPDVRVDLAVESRYVDIAAGEADIAIRPGDMPDHPSLVVRRLGGNPMAVYCSEAYAGATASRPPSRSFSSVLSRAWQGACSTWSLSITPSIVRAWWRLACNRCSTPSPRAPSRRSCPVTTPIQCRD